MYTYIYISHLYIHLYNICIHIYIWRFSKSLRTCPGNNESFRWILPQASAQLPHCFRGAGNITFAGFVNSWRALLDNQTRMNQHSSGIHSIRMFTFFLVKLKTPIWIIKAPTLAVIHLNQEGTNRSKNDMRWRTSSLHKKWPIAPETQDWPWIASANPSAHLPRNIRQILEALCLCFILI